MACLGVHVAVGAEEVRSLLSREGQDGILEVLDGIRKAGGDDAQASSGSSWDAMHRCLSNGTLYIDEGEPPLNLAVLGGKHLYDGDDRVVVYVAPDRVTEISAALGPLTREWLRSRYDAIDPDEYDGPVGEPDFAALWEGFQKVRKLYRRAASDGWAVVFTVDP